LQAEFLDFTIIFADFRDFIKTQKTKRRT